MVNPLLIAEWIFKPQIRHNMECGDGQITLSGFFFPQTHQDIFLISFKIYLQVFVGLSNTVNQNRLILNTTLLTGFLSYMNENYICISS